MPPTTQQTNKAAYQTALKSHPFTITPTPLPTPSPTQLLLRVRAIGINPADAAVQNLGMVYTAAQHPLILGFDVAGTVHAIGSGVTRFKPGDRVCAFTPPEGHGKSHEGAFQEFCLASEWYAARIPDGVGFAEAAVLPSCLSVAAYALFRGDTMGLELPPLAHQPEQRNGKVVVVWGGSSVAGSCAIQLARLAGYDVVATSSELNFGHCRELGAESVFDYKSPGVVGDVVAACRGRESAGVFVAYFDDKSTVACSVIASRLGGRRVLGTVVPPYFPVPEGVAEGVEVTSNWNPALSETSEGRYIWEQWLTPALADGRLKLLPRPEIAGKGLEALQGAVDTQFGRIHMFGLQEGKGQVKNMSPRKLVVEID